MTMIAFAALIVLLALLRVQYVRGQHLAYRRAMTRVQLRTNKDNE